MKTLCACLGLWTWMTGLVGSVWAAEAEVDIGTVSPIGGRPVYTIAIPDFQPIEGSRALEPGVFNSIIYNDLILSGFFQAVKDQRQVEEQAGRDRQSGKTDFAQWQAQAANFLAVGEYRMSGSDDLVAAAKLFSVADGGRVLGRQYPGKASNYRALAHWIADDIVFHVTSIRGIASAKIVHIGRQSQSREVFVTDIDGQNQRPLTADHSLDATPTWGANGTEVYYTSYKDFNPDLCGVFLTGAQSWFISRRYGFNLSPDYNASKGLIALTLAKDGNHEIYTMDRNGRNLTRLTYNSAIDGSSSWSPNGSQIAFTSDRTGSPQTYVMNSDGTNQRRITFSHYYNDSADWSPRGDRIAFASQVQRSDEFNIYTMNVDGSNWRQLTRDASNNEDPSWAPDGEHIVFSSNRTGSYQLYIMNADGSNVHQLTTKGENYSPDVSPLP